MAVNQALLRTGRGTQVALGGTGWGQQPPPIFKGRTSHTAQLLGASTACPPDTLIFFLKSNAPLRGRDSHPHWTDMEIEAQRRAVTCPRPGTFQGLQLGKRWCSEPVFPKLCGHRKHPDSSLNTLDRFPGPLLETLTGGGAQGLSF